MTSMLGTYAPFENIEIKIHKETKFIHVHYPQMQNIYRSAILLLTPNNSIFFSHGNEYFFRK